MKRDGKERSKLSTIRERLRKWFGHVLIRDSVLRTSIEWRKEGNRKTQTDVASLDNDGWTQKA